METQKHIILLCEDDPFIAPMYAHELQREGYNVIMVESGDKVIPTMHEYRPELVILDMILPGEMGFEVLQDLQKETDLACKNTPVVMLSNLNQQDVIDNAKRLGAVEYLVKSRITPKELGDKIREYIPVE